MAGLRARRPSSLSGKLLSRRQTSTLPGRCAGEDICTQSHGPIGSVPDWPHMTGTIPSSENAARIRPAGPLGRTGRTLSLRLDGERHHALHLASRATGLSQQQLVLAAIDLWLGARAGAPPSVPPRR